MIKLGFRFTLLILFTIPFLTTGCTHHSGPSQTITSILSDPSADGEIYLTSSSTVILQVLSSNIQDLYAGVDLGTNYGDEHRAFLDFPLGGSDGVPTDAIIDSATLELYVNSIQSETTNTVPIFIDLVEYDPINGLIPADYDNPEIDYISVNLPTSLNSASNPMITIDVTSLMEKAQNIGLSDFQVRILEDTGATYYGIINIDDRTSSDRASYAPQLTVTYH